MTTNPLVDHPDREPLAEGGTWLLDLVAAVDHLRRGHRPGLTVWDALEEALRWTTSDDDAAWDTPDPLAATLRQLLDQTDTAGGRQDAGCRPPVGDGDGRPLQRRSPLAPPGTAARLPTTPPRRQPDTTTTSDAYDGAFVCCV